METTLYAVSRFGNLIFNVGAHTIIDGVRPIDVNSLKYIRQSINENMTELDGYVIYSQLIFTNVRNTAEG